MHNFNYCHSFGPIAFFTNPVTTHGPPYAFEFSGIYLSTKLFAPIILPTLMVKSLPFSSDQQRNAPMEAFSSIFHVSLGGFDPGEPLIPSRGYFPQYLLMKCVVFNSDQINNLLFCPPDKCSETKPWTDSRSK